jgi:ATP-dependent DNA helicase RecG
VHEEVKTAVALGEGQCIEFKEQIAGLEKEISALANSRGGNIYCGIADDGQVIGFDVSNRMLSQIQDIARNMDPPVAVQVQKLGTVVVVRVPESEDKPHQCRTGFYLRMGANSQKLRAAEIHKLFSAKIAAFENQVRLDVPLAKIDYEAAYKKYCQLAKIPENLPPKQVLNSLGAIQSRDDKKFFFTNLGLLLFASEPRRFMPESQIVGVTYKTESKFSILNRKDFYGPMVEQIEDAFAFFENANTTSYSIDAQARRREIMDYPPVAIREAIINAIVHRDYSMQSMCTYLNFYSDRLEIENPGGIPLGLSLEEVEGKSLRRNPLLAESLYRAGYGEKLGSGFVRMRECLVENNNPELEVSSNHYYFSIRFRPAPKVNASLHSTKHDYSNRQVQILSLLQKAAPQSLSSSDLALNLGVSVPTITRELKFLLQQQIVFASGKGRSLRYFWQNS